MLNTSGFINISESDKKFESIENTILKGFVNNDPEKDVVAKKEKKQEKSK